MIRGTRVPSAPALVAKCLSIAKVHCFNEVQLGGVAVVIRNSRAGRQ
jgi:hypothetical protein